MEPYQDIGYGTLCCAVSLDILLFRGIESKSLSIAGGKISSKDIYSELNKLPRGPNDEFYINETFLAHGFLIFNSALKSLFWHREGCSRTLVYH